MNVSGFEGCLLGLALGDAMGAPHEGGPLERLMWRLIGTTRDGNMRFTDDTQMSLDLGESLVERGGVDEDDLARRFAHSYRFSRGYGPGAAKLLKRIARGAHWREASRSVYRDGSLGNGGAMRAPVIGIFHAAHLEQIAEAARRSAAVTHAHPLGMEGAVVIATATALALLGHEAIAIVDGVAGQARLEPFTSRLAVARAWLIPLRGGGALEGREPTVAEVRSHLGNRITAGESCVTALYLALRHLDRPFLDLHRAAVVLGGDVDTISAMAGAIWGAARGASDLPQDALSRLEGRENLRALASALVAASSSAGT
jgi:poly(ADP-ribose) glycohydrolase ARH3